MSVSFYVLNDEGQALSLDRKYRGGPYLPVWKHPYKEGGYISSYDARDAAKENGGTVVRSDDPRVADQIRAASKADDEKRAAQKAAYEEVCRKAAENPDKEDDEFWGHGGLHCD